MNFYHGTSENNLPGIMRDGLIPKGGQGADAWALKTDPEMAQELLDDPERVASVYLTPIAILAIPFAEWTAEHNKSKPVILKIDAAGIKTATVIKRDEQMPAAIRCVCKIEPKYILEVIRPGDESSLEA